MKEKKKEKPLQTKAPIIAYNDFREILENIDGNGDVNGDKYL